MLQDFMAFKCSIHHLHGPVVILPGLQGRLIFIIKFVIGRSSSLRFEIGRFFPRELLRAFVF